MPSPLARTLPAPVCFAFLFALLSAVAPGLSAKPAPGKGYASFKQAYALEEEGQQDRRAMQLYREALQRGLKRDLRTAARWRLYFLYRKYDLFLNAREILPVGYQGEGARLRKELRDYSQTRLQLPEPDLRQYYLGLGYFQKPTARERRLAFGRLQSLWQRYPEHAQLQASILYYVQSHRRMQDAITLLEQHPEPDSEYAFQLAALYQQQAEWRKLELVLAPYLKRQTCLPQWLYLPADAQAARAHAYLARAAQQRGRRTQAAEHYARAARLSASMSTRRTYAVRAAYQYYRRQNYAAARDILEDLPRSAWRAHCNAQAIYWLSREDRLETAVLSEYRSLIRPIQSHCARNVRKELRQGGLLP